MLDALKNSEIPSRQAEAVTIEIHQEVDIVRARGRARGFAQTVGFGSTDQTKIATAVSEVSRNIFVYAHEGTVRLLPLVGKRGLRIEARDKGPGIVGLDTILSGEYNSRTGMGLGLRGCKRLMDRFQVETTQGKGTVVIMEKEIA
jgi:serine/threonine-protein kinase RsbT